MSGTDAETLLDTLFYTQTVAAAGDWDRLLPAAAGNGMSDAERCVFLLRATNGERMSKAAWDHFIGANVPNVIEDADYAAIPQARTSLIAGLERVIENPETAINAKRFGMNVADILNGKVAVLPRMVVYGQRWRIENRVVSQSAGVALVHALALFLDPTRDFGRRLTQCHFASCKNFALKPPPTTRGQPPHYFCSDEHRDQHRRVYERERKRAQRKET